jgi:endoglucanase
MKHSRIGGSALVAIVGLCATAYAAVQIQSSSTSTATPVQITAPAATQTSSAAPMTTAATSTTAAATSRAATTLVAKPYRGINVSGGEFGGGNAPGKMGTNYIYPTKAEIDYYASLGFTIIRVPFMWERIQPTLNGPLSTNDQKYLRDAVSYARAKNMKVVLDMHNYGQRAIGSNYQTLADVGSSQVPVSALTDAWVKLASEYKDGTVWLGLMNEPHTMNAATWWPRVKQLVKELRAAGLKQRLLVPGTAWTGAYSWVSSGNAANYTGFSDPLNDYAIEVHQYLDADSSGTTGNCVAGAGARVADVINWSKANGNIRLFMGEMGASSGTQCGIEYRDMINRMEASKVFLGWTAWGGGTWWNANYFFRTLTTAWPSTATVTPHMSYLLEYARK